ncbi:MAG: hypothetical protein AAF346_15065 [Pseudomonadota bacterium]
MPIRLRHAAMVMALCVLVYKMVRVISIICKPDLIKAIGASEVPLKAI